MLSFKPVFSLSSFIKRLFDNSDKNREIMIMKHWNVNYFKETMSCKFIECRKVDWFFESVVGIQEN